MRRLAALALVLLVLGPVACSRGEEQTPVLCIDTDGGKPVSPSLLAFLSRARAAHHRADLQEEKGDLAAARRDLSAITDGTTPQGAPEVDEVLADTHSRLADLASRAGEFDAAGRHRQRGLALATAPTYFRGHLFEVKGVVAQRRAAKLASDGDERAAAVAKQEALAAYEESMRIQAEVIDRALPVRPPGSTPPGAPK